MQKDVLLSSSGSSVASVDTDLKFSADDLSPVGKKPFGSFDAGVDGSFDAGVDGCMGAGGDDGDAGTLVADEVVKHHRHPPGTWTIWESTWFYMTQTPGWTDIKCLVKWQFRSVTTGMGPRWFSRTLSPHHYGDDLRDPWRSILLLRYWIS